MPYISVPAIYIARSYPTPQGGFQLTHIIQKSFWWQPNNGAGEGIESGFIFRWSDRLGI